MAKRTKSSIRNQTTGAIRLNKYLSDAGVCSRREADKYIEEGKVLVDGKPAVIGMTVSDDQEVVFCKKPVKRQKDLVLIAFNKPRGIVCTTDPKEPDNIINFINYGKRIYPIGRLDKDSQGLILLTNDGEIVNKILRAGNHHEKEYVVRVNKPITEKFLEGMSSGVPILDTVTNPCKIQAEGKDTFRIFLTQGLNRQIRRMCEFFGYNVLSLQRIRIMNIRLGRLYEGAYRNVTDQELNELLGRIEESTNAAGSSEIKQDGMQSQKIGQKQEFKHRQGNKYEQKQGNRFEQKQENKFEQKQGNRFEQKQGNKFEQKQGNRLGQKQGNKYEQEQGNKQGNRFEQKQGNKSEQKQGNKFGQKQGNRFEQKQGNKFEQKQGNKFEQKQGNRFEQKQGNRFEQKQGNRFEQKQGNKFEQKQGNKIGQEQGKELEQKQGNKAGQKQGKEFEHKQANKTGLKQGQKQARRYKK